MPLPCSAVILAGGLSTRFDGQDKARLEIRQRSILDRLLGVCRPLFEELVLVTNTPTRYLEHDLLIVADLFPHRSSLTGIHAGLFYTRGPCAFVTACDAPFLQAGLVRLLVEALEPAVDVVVPSTAKGFEPLCAVYSRRCLPHMEAQLQRGALKIRDLFARVRVRQVPEARLREVDPDLRSFINVNTPADLAAARNLPPAGGGPRGSEGD